MLSWQNLGERRQLQTPDMSSDFLVLILLKGSTSNLQRVNVTILSDIT